MEHVSLIGRMATVQPREALTYALSREMAVLYGVLILGYIVVLFGGLVWSRWAFRGGGAGFIGQLLSAGLVLLGFLAILGGFIGFIYKVIADANHVART